MDIFSKNSPRSKSAIELLDLNEKNLYYISFVEFMKSHPELIKFDKSHQLKMFNHMEEKRRKNIENAIKKRNQLINMSLESPKQEKNIDQFPSILTSGESLIQHNGEKEKFRQMLILKTKINYDLNLYEKEQKNKEKYLNKEKCIDELKQWKQKMKEEKILKEQLSEMRRKEKLKFEYEEFLKYLNDVKEREQKIDDNVEKTQKEKLEENNIRKTVNRQKEEEFKEKLEMLNNIEQEKINNKREKLRLKYLIQKTNLDGIKKEKSNESLMKSRNNEEKTIKAFNEISQLEINNYNHKIHLLKIKQDSVKKNKKKLFEEINEKIKEQDILYNQKEKKISNLFLKNELNLIKKGEEYKKRYLNMALKKKEIDCQNKQNIIKRNTILKEKGEKCKEARLKEEKENELYRKRLFQKINLSQNKMSIKRMKNNNDLKEKLHNLNLKIEDINDNLKVQEKLYELKKIKKIEKMEEKNKRLEQRKYLKLQLQEKRKNINKSIEIDKERLMHKYSLLKLSSNKSKIDVLKSLFPEDYAKNSMVS